MALHEFLSLLSAITMASVLYVHGRFHPKGSICSMLQVAAYLMLSASSWLAGIRTAAFVLAVCAVTHTLRVLRRYPKNVAGICSVITLAGGLLVNNRGWMGIPPLLAALGVVRRHARQYEVRLPRSLFPRSMWAEIAKGKKYIVSETDNANRLRSHALDLFMENIIGVAMWGTASWLAGDYFILTFRGAELIVNAFDYIKRIRRVLFDVFGDALPNTRGNKRRRFPGQKKQRDWYI